MVAPSMVNGMAYIQNDTTAKAATELNIAYNNLKAKPATRTFLTSTAEGQVFTSGI